jgi:hypothetical protein
MAGSIFFTRRNWSSRSSATFYVFEFLISRLPDGESKSRLQEYVDNNIPMLDLRDPAQSQLVDLIADDLPQHIKSIEDPVVRENLNILLADLFLLAKEQQVHNAKTGEGTTRPVTDR